MHNTPLIFQMILRVFTVSTMILKAMKLCSTCLLSFPTLPTIGIVTMIGYVELCLGSSAASSRPVASFVKTVHIPHYDNYFTTSPLLNLIISGVQGIINLYYAARFKKWEFAHYGLLRPLHLQFFPPLQIDASKMRWGNHNI